MQSLLLDAFTWQGFLLFKRYWDRFHGVKWISSCSLLGAENTLPHPASTRIDQVLEAIADQCHAKKMWTCHRAVVLGIPLCLSYLLSLCSAACICQSSWYLQGVDDSAKRFIVQLILLAPWVCAWFLLVLMAGQSNHSFSVFANVSHKSQQAH